MSFQSTVRMMSKLTRCSNVLASTSTILRETSATYLSTNFLIYHLHLLALIVETLKLVRHIDELRADLKNRFAILGLETSNRVRLPIRRREPFET